MVTSIREKIARQLELEDESRALGSARYRSMRPLPWRTTTSTTEEESSLPPGRQLLKLAIEPTAQAIDEWCALIAGGGAGRRHNAYRLLSQAGSQEVAYLTGRVVLNATALQLTLTATAFQVAALLTEHIEMLLLKEANKDGFKGLIKSQKKAKSSSKRRQALRKIMNNEGTRLRVPQEEQLSVGLKAIELLCDSTGLFRIEHSTRGESMGIVPTDAVVRWLDQQHARCELLEPIHMPMVVRPRRWRTPFWGGYLTKRPGIRLVKQWAGPYHSELRNIDMPEVYAAVNAVQDVPWQINDRILNLMIEVWDGGGNLGGLPQRDDDPMPGKPEDFEINEDARRDWMREAAKTHQANAYMMSKRLAFQQRLWVATKFREEEEIFFPHDLDFRGRVYPIPTGGPHPQGDDPAKALLRFAEGMPLGDDGPYWLMVHIANLFGVYKVTTATIEDLMTRMEKDGSKPGTIKRKLDSLFKALRKATEWDGGNGSDVPVLTVLPKRPELKVENLKDRVITDDELAAIMKAVLVRANTETARDWHRFRVLLQFLRDTGCRLSEALQLVEKGIELRDMVRGQAGDNRPSQRMWVTFPRYTTKNGKPRCPPLTIQTQELMPGVISRAVNERVFPLLPQTAWYMWDTIRADVKKAGLNIDDVNLHTFRHTCITALVKVLPIQKASIWAGHSDVSITLKRYGHLCTEDMLDCVEELDA